MFQVNHIPEYDQNQDTNVPVNVINVSMVSLLGHQASVSKLLDGTFNCVLLAS